MSNARAVSSDRRSQVHTEVRAPVEVVVSRIITFVFAVIEVFIGIRFVLMLFGANAEAGFVKLIYSVSGVFMAPFIAIFDTQKAGGAVFEWSALVAIAVYALVAWGLVALIRAVNPRQQSETVERVESEDDSVAQQ
ncbi:MAG: YggT family protein [Actinobacteria bacterium]|nr:YggT family protein [Actinomycetota bacterium]MCG2808439.1 YggT family protein [Coriobacteriia bacterium]